MKKKLAIATLAIATLSGALLLTACGSKTVYVTVEPSTTTTPKTTTTTEARVSRPPVSVLSRPSYDPDGYDEMLWSEANEFWWQFTQEELLNMGLVICQQFDMGRTLDQVTSQLIDILIANGIPEYSLAIGTMMGSALIYLCPEHEWWLDTI